MELKLSKDAPDAINLFICFTIFGHSFVFVLFFPKENPRFQVIVFKIYFKVNCTFFQTSKETENCALLRATF